MLPKKGFMNWIWLYHERQKFPVMLIYEVASYVAGREKTTDLKKHTHPGIWSMKFSILIPCPSPSISRLPPV